jgi:hypothetical protein
MASGRRASPGRRNPDCAYAGLRRQFADAHATLDIIESKLDNAPSTFACAYLLERGRTFNSSGLPGARSAAFFRSAFARRVQSRRVLRVDAAHMLGIAAPVQERARWNAKALEMTERSSTLVPNAGSRRSTTILGQAHLEGGQVRDGARLLRQGAAGVGGAWRRW